MYEKRSKMKQIKPKRQQKEMHKVSHDARHRSLRKFCEIPM